MKNRLLAGSLVLLCGALSALAAASVDLSTVIGTELVLQTKGTFSYKDDDDSQKNVIFEASTIRFDVDTFKITNQDGNELQGDWLIDGKGKLQLEVDEQSLTDFVYAIADEFDTLDGCSLNIVL